MEDFDRMEEFLLTWKKLKFALEFDGKMQTSKKVKAENIYGKRS